MALCHLGGENHQTYCSCARCSSKDVVELMMLTQWIDMMRDIGQNGRQTVFMPHSPAGMADVTAQMRNGVLQGGAAVLQ